MEDVTVTIVGAGPSGLATSACLNHFSIPNIILEKEDCCGSLWKKRAYDRVRILLEKDICALPYKPHDSSTPTFMPKDTFVEYLDAYVSEFELKPRLGRVVEKAWFDQESEKWKVEAKNVESGEVEAYVSRFLVVATGQNEVGFVPDVDGLEGFGGDVVHSSEYKNGSRHGGKDVLVVGCGNSGMDIAYDLHSFGANASIVIKSPFHVVRREMMQQAMQYLKFLPLNVVDIILTYEAQKYYGDLSEYGIIRPAAGPLFLIQQGQIPTIDVAGTIDLIKNGDVKVLPEIVRIDGNEVEFQNGKKKRFDAIVFATGYKSSADKWLKENKSLVLDENDRPMNVVPNHFKGVNRIYCAGFSRMGIDGIAKDALAIADDIFKIMSSVKKVEVVAKPTGSDDIYENGRELKHEKCGGHE